MINNVVLVGRVCNDIKLYTTENGFKVANIILAVQRPFKNQDDTYDTDFLDIKVMFATAEISAEYFTKGSIVGVKGRVQAKSYIVDGKKVNGTEIIGERVSFIHMNRKNEEEAETM